MTVLVLSDSHGDLDAVAKAAQREKPDIILHLGDHDSDVRGLRRLMPDVPVRTVRGNCDPMSAAPETDEFVLGDQRIFMTHGHLYNVKTGLGSVLNAAMIRGADVLLYGHTHRAHDARADTLLVVNPGSTGRGEKTYAVLEIENGAIKSRIINLNLKG